MGVESMEIKLSKSIYHPGEEISGTCNIKVNDQGKHSVKSVELRFLGRAKAKWVERFGRTSATCREFLDMFPTMEQKLTGPNGKLLPGTHTLPFSFHLPETVLATFTGRFGYVRYKLMLKAPEDDLFTKRQKAGKPVTVALVIDINDPGYSVPVSAREEKMIGFCCFTSGPLVVEAKVDRKGYCCKNDGVCITATFTNKSSEQVKSFVKLICRKEYHAQGSSTSEEQVWSLSEADGAAFIMIAQGATVEWKAKAYKFPSETLPISMKCSLIELSYILKVGLDIPGNPNLEASLPIVIGTVPLKGTVLENEPIQTEPQPQQGGDVSDSD